MSFDLSALAKQALGSWATGSCTVTQLSDAARHLGWTEVPMRPREPALTALRPQTQAQANPRSLSATYGLGPQPLHTDGAHLPEPPDWIVLLAEAPNTTPTALRAVPHGASAVPWHAMLSGIFLVRSGTQPFLAHAATGIRIRYDPGCMTPCDQRARIAAQFLADRTDTHEHNWTQANQILLIDNRQTLHARLEVSDTDTTTRVLHRLAFTRKAQ